MAMLACGGSKTINSSLKPDDLTETYIFLAEVLRESTKYNINFTELGDIEVTMMPKAGVIKVVMTHRTSDAIRKIYMDLYVRTP